MGSILFYLKHFKVFVIPKQLKIKWGELGIRIAKYNYHEDLNRKMFIWTKSSISIDFLMEEA